MPPITPFASLPFVGRTAELAELEDSFARTGEGAAAVLIGGEAGVGKSRLIAEFTAGLSGRARVLLGGCLELGDSGLPFAPFTAVLRGLVRTLGREGVLALLPRGEAGEISRLLPALGTPDGAEGELARARLFEQILALLQELAESQPVLLVIEDAHWADRSSRDLLTFIVRNQGTVAGLLVIVTYRSDQLSRDHPLRPLLAEMDRIGWASRLELGRLTKSAVADQLRGLLGHEPDAGLGDRIYERSEGNPLFVESLLMCGGGLLPQSLRDLLVRPLELLPEQTQDVVRSATPGGVRVGHALLAAVTGLNDVDLSNALRPAVRSNLMVVENDAYVFRHSLIREVINDDLLPGERTRLHVRYAEALERDRSLTPPGRVSIELAHHWYAAANPTKALTAAWRAALAARSSLAYAEQLHMLTQVLELWDDVPDAASYAGIGRAAVRQEAIQAAISAGESEHAIALIEAALDETADQASAGRMLRHRGLLRHGLGIPGGLDDLREAVRLVPPGDSARALVLHSLAARLLTIPLEEQGRAVAREAILAARAIGDVRSEAMAEINLAYALARAGDIDGQLPRLRIASETAARLGDHELLRWAVRCKADLLESFGRHEQAIEASRRGIAAATDAGLARTSGPTHAGNLAEALFSLGRWDEAEEILEHALELGPAPNFRAYLLVVRGSIALARGDLTRAEAAADYARTVFVAGASDAQDGLLLSRLEADLRLAQGRTGDVHDLVRKSPAGHEAEPSSRYLWPLLTAGACAGMDDIRDLAAGVPVIGPVQRAHELMFEAELAAGDRRAAWDRAATAWEDLRQPYPQAYALLRAAEIAAGEGDRDATEVRLRTAAAHADRLAAHPLRARIDRVSRVARLSAAEDGDATPRQQSISRLGLTPRELQVLRLVADGRTNRQIAEELFISGKTVSVHVSNILAKFDVTSRVQAATAAHRLQILDGL